MKAPFNSNSHTNTSSNLTNWGSIDSEIDKEYEKLSNHMVESGYLTRKEAQEAIYLCRKHSIGFDEALMILERKKLSVKPVTTKSNISGVEANIVRRLVEENIISHDFAGQIVKDALENDWNVIDILAENQEFVTPQLFEIEAVTLIINSNLVNEKEDSRYQHAKSLRPLLYLIANGTITSNMADAAIKCAELINNRYMSLQEARLIVRFAFDNDTNFSQSSKQLGLTYKKEALEKTESSGFTQQLKASFANLSNKITTKLNYQNG